MKLESVYIHIPFCANICTYCDFPKIYLQEKLIDLYLIELEEEIKKNYKNELIKTIYIGGGTPSVLSIKQLKELFRLVDIFKINELEFTVEFNVEDINIEKLKLLKDNGVNRISIGVQSFNDKYLKLMNRNYDKDIILNNVALAKKYFNNINIDLIYALPNQTLDELKMDLEMFLELGVDHISTYSLILEPNTILYINKTKEVSEDIDATMYDHIKKTLKQNGYIHYEISNFYKETPSLHNLMYWNNKEYYGFGLGASGYVDDFRYSNTRSINNYLKGKYKIEEENIDKNQKIEYEFILGLRKTSGINKEEFKGKYNINLREIAVVEKLLREGKLVEDEFSIKICDKYLYIQNTILVDFLGENYG